MQTSSDFIPLLDAEFFPWEGLPYPCEHAQLGVELMRKGEIDAAQKIAAYQQATIDHRGKPIYSFFQQESGCRFAELEEASRAFFNAVGVEPKKEYHYVNDELGIVYHRKNDQTMLCLASGCKTGMGAFLVRDGGFLTFGPQLFPVGECSGYGLAGRGQRMEVAENRLKYQCRLAAPHERDTGIPWLSDSGYAGAWIESTCAIDPDNLTVSCAIEGYRPLSDILFSFFIKADACYIAGSHKLSPRSLDRYQGPPQTIKLDGVSLIPEEGFQAMEVLPLAGDGSYWGADFIVSLVPLNKNFNFSISKI